jgi:hypothetical protein
MFQFSFTKQSGNNEGIIKLAIARETALLIPKANEILYISAVSK